jgi:hypothetical protein
MTQVYRFNDKYGEFEVNADHEWEATAQAAVIRADRAAPWRFVDSGKPMTEEYKAKIIQQSDKHINELNIHIARLNDSCIASRREAARQDSIDTAIESAYIEPVNGEEKRQHEPRLSGDSDNDGFIGSPGFVVISGVGLVAIFVLAMLLIGIVRGVP